MRKGICFLLVFLWIFAAFAGCKNEKTPDSTGTTLPPSTLVESPAADFLYEMSQDGQRVYINQYIGTAESVVIPSKIEDFGHLPLHRGGSRFALQTAR